MSLIGLGLYSHTSQQQRFVQNRIGVESIDNKSKLVYVGGDDNSKALHKPLLI